jgi:AcrR family transcriptional regulator
VSGAAGLNSRYFYESYSSREDLLYAVYQRIVVDIFTLAAEAVAREDTIQAKARAGIRAGWTAVTEDRRKARVVALEVVGVSDRTERLRRRPGTPWPGSPPSRRCRWSAPAPGCGSTRS